MYVGCDTIFREIVSQSATLGTTDNVLMPHRFVGRVLLGLYHKRIDNIVVVDRCNLAPMGCLYVDIL